MTTPLTQPKDNLVNSYGFKEKLINSALSVDDDDVDDDDDDDFDDDLDVEEIDVD